MEYPKILQKLISLFKEFPGIGNKTAERIAFYILINKKEKIFELTKTIEEVKEKIKSCVECYNITEEEKCEICKDPTRDRSIICVVETPKDLVAIEKTGNYKGVYHVLMGNVEPLEDLGEKFLTINKLVERVERNMKKEKIREIIIATNPNVEGDSISFSIYEALKKYPIKITRIARGIPSGSLLEGAHTSILVEALSERRPIGLDENKEEEKSKEEKSKEDKKRGRKKTKKTEKTEKTEELKNIEKIENFIKIEEIEDIFSNNNNNTNMKGKNNGV